MPPFARTIVALLLCGQVAAPAQQQTPPVFQTSTLLIVQTVTVKDKKGKPIEGLTAKDFVVTEDGVPQQIAFVEYQKLDAPPATAEIGQPATTAASQPPVTVAPLTQVGDTLPAAPVPGDARFRGKRLIVLYIDLASLSFFDAGRVFDGVRRYVGRDMTATDMVSVFTYSNSRVRMRLDFTDDRAALVKVIGDLEQAQVDAEQGIVALDDYRSAFGEDDETFSMFASDRKLAALQTTVTNLGPLPEMKTLIYFGSLNLGVDNMAQVRSTVNAAVRSNVTINPVDVRGLTAGAPMGDATRPSPGGVGMFSGAIAQNTVRRSLNGQDSYYSLAKDTGGTAFFNNNDLSMGITQAAQAVTGYYMLAYYTRNAAKDGKFRRVKVTLSPAVAAGAELSYRAGYYGAKEWAKFNDFDKDRQLEEALRLEDPITDIPLALEVNYFQINSAEYFIPISVRMPGSELTRARPAGDTKALIDMLTEIKDEYGVTIRNTRDKLEFKLDFGSAQEVSRKPIQYETAVSMLPGRYVVKVLARDATTGRIGTFMKEFVVPNLDKENTRLRISTVVLSTLRVPPANALSAVRQRIPATAANPLVSDGLQLIPSVTRTFSAAVPIYVYLEAYERDLPAPPAGASGESASPRSLIAYATIYREGAKVFETEPLAVDSWNPQTRTLPIRLFVPAGRLGPGAYDCQVTVLDPAADRSAFWRATITIVR